MTQTSIGAPAFRPWEQWSRVGARWPKYNLESDQARGLVAWWSCFGFESGWGLLRDVLGLYHITAYNSPIIVGSEFGTVVELDDGSSQYLEIDSAPITEYPATLTAWIKSDVTNINQTAIFIGDKDVSNQYHILWVAADALPKVSTRAIVTQTATATSGISADTWHHVAGVFAGAESRSVLIDGGSKGTNINNITPTGLDRVAIGRSGDSSPGQYWSGSIAEVRIYNRAFSDAEVAALYDPRTRWELYEIPQRIWYVPPTVIRIPRPTAAYNNLAIY